MPPPPPLSLFLPLLLAIGIRSTAPFGLCTLFLKLLGVSRGAVLSSFARTISFSIAVSSSLYPSAWLGTMSTGSIAIVSLGAEGAREGCDPVMLPSTDAAEGVRENTRGFPAIALPCNLPRVFPCVLEGAMAAASWSLPNLPRISEMPERLLLFRSGGSMDPRVEAELLASLIRRLEHSTRGPETVGANATCGDGSCWLLEGGGAIGGFDSTLVVRCSSGSFALCGANASWISATALSAVSECILYAFSSTHLPVSWHLHNQSRETIEQLTIKAATLKSLAESNGFPGAAQCTR